MNALQDKYIHPLTDFGFKKLFGSEPNKDLLIDFLNQVLPPQHQIGDLSYARTEHLGASELDRKAIFDLYCIGESGERFIVELQKAKQNFFKDRSLFYASFPIQEQAKRGEWDYRLAPVYSIGILDFIFEEHKAERELLHVVELKDQHCEVFYDKLRFVYIELPKFKKQENDLHTQFDKWLYVLRHLSALQERPARLQDRVFQKLFDAAEIAKFSPEDRSAYEDSLKYYRDLSNVVDTARQEGLQEGLEKGLQEGLEKGLQEGLEKGLQEGLEKGLQEGLEKGLQEGLEKGLHQRSLDIAKQMKTKGLPIADIAELTGLGIAELDAL